MFVNLWGPAARPSAGLSGRFYDLVRRRTGIDFDPHWCRHTAATRFRDGVPIEVVSKLLGHAGLTLPLACMGT